MEDGNQLGGILLLLLLLVLALRGCAGQERAASAQRQLYALHQSVDALRADNAASREAQAQALKRLAEAQHRAAGTEGQATTGTLSIALVGGALILVSGALSATLLALRNRSRRTACEDP